MKLLNPIRDWLRGYSDQDVISACRAFTTIDSTYGRIVYITKREQRAMIKEELDPEKAQRLLKQRESPTSS